MRMTRSRWTASGSLSPYPFFLGFAGGVPGHVVR
jgi:hypothetical protein